MAQRVPIRLSQRILEAVHLLHARLLVVEAAQPVAMRHKPVVPEVEVSQTRFQLLSLDKEIQVALVDSSGEVITHLVVAVVPVA
jgi:hypothetical protein